MCGGGWKYNGLVAIKKTGRCGSRRDQHYHLHLKRNKMGQFLKRNRYYCQMARCQTYMGEAGPIQTGQHSNFLRHLPLIR